MELSAGLFKQTLKGLKSEWVGGEKDKRKNPRAQLRRKIRIHHRAPNNKAVTTEVWLTDISSGGVGIQRGESMTAGEKFVIQLPGDRNDGLTLLCTVRNSRLVRNGVFTIGATFSEVIPTQTPVSAPVKARAPVTPSTTEANPPSPQDTRTDEMMSRIRVAIFD